MVSLRPLARTLVIKATSVYVCITTIYSGLLDYDTTVRVYDINAGYR